MSGNCHTYEDRFTGHAIPARPGLTVVSIQFNGSSGEHTVWKQEVHAWGTFREVLIDRGKIVQRCSKCGEENSDPSSTLYPLVLCDGSLEHVPWSLNSFLGDTVVGVFENDEGMEESIGDAVKRGRKQWAQWHAERQQAVAK